MTRGQVADNRFQHGTFGLWGLGFVHLHEQAHCSNPLQSQCHHSPPGPRGRTHHRLHPPVVVVLRLMRDAVEFQCGSGAR